MLQNYEFVMFIALLEVLREIPINIIYWEGGDCYAGYSVNARNVGE